jgi:glycosyltransferase involved in cell wall biosynthesis
MRHKISINLAILIWSNSRFGGAERRFARLADYLTTHYGNIEVTLYCLPATLVPLSVLGINPNKMKIIQVGFGVNSKLLSKLNKLLVVFQLILLICLNKHDHLFIASNPSLISYFLTRFSVVLPRVSVAMVDITYAQSSSWWDRYFAKQTLRKVYSVDCLSEGVMAGFLKTIDVQDKEKIRVAPCSFTDYSKVKNSLNRDIDIVMVGRLVPYKGHDLLGKISGQLSQYEIHVCGSGLLRPSIPFAKIYEADDSFAILSRAKVSLSLQLFGNYPSQVVLESMASGCAIIATDTGETRKFLDESCAILIPYDADALASAIESLLSNPKKCYQLGQQARKKVLSEHTIERYADYFLNEVLA